MSKPLQRLSVATGTLLLTQIFHAGVALAVPMDKLAWSSQEQKIKVYRDAVDQDLYWYIPKIRFEANNGKTVLRPKTLANGKVEYSTRIIPYFTQELRELVAQNISNIRSDAQLQPVVAKNIAISLPDFNYKFSSPSVTDYQYLDVPRLVRFQLDRAEAKAFDELYQDDLGVTVEFSVTYEGMVTDKFYNIDVSCKSMARELSTNFKPSASVSGNVKGVKAYVGADIERAFLQSVQNSTNVVNVLSSGDMSGMQEMLRQVMNLCFEPVDSYESDYPRSRSRRSTDDEEDGDYPSRTRGDAVDDGFTPRNQFVGGSLANRSRSEVSLASREAALMRNLHNQLDLAREPAPSRSKPSDEGDEDPAPTEDRSSGGDAGLLPSAKLKVGYALKKTQVEKNNQAVVKNVSMKSSTNTVVVVDRLSANARAVEKVSGRAISEKKFTVGPKSTSAAPLSTGIKVNAGEQYTINAEFTFAAMSSYSPWKAKQYDWDSSWDKVDGDLYYRLGSGEWRPVSRRTIITSDVIRTGGELQFYVDRSAIFNKIPEKLRKGNILVGPVFTVDKINPTFTVQVSGRRIEVR